VAIRKTAENQVVSGSLLACRTVLAVTGGLRATGGRLIGEASRGYAKLTIALMANIIYEIGNAKPLWWGLGRPAAYRPAKT